MSTEKVSREQAQSEVESWLDYKKVGSQKRETNKDSIEFLISAIVEGDLTVDEDKNLIQKLKFPPSGDLAVSALKYKPRVTVKVVNTRLTGIKSDDINGRICAYASALTGVSRELIKDMETDDFGLVQNIVLFFL
jgi:hypothetical protein